MRYLFLSLLFIFTFNSLFAQIDSTKTSEKCWYKEFGIKGAYVYNNFKGFELGFIKYPNYLFNVEDPSTYNPFVSFDFLFKDSKTLYQPKIGIDYQFFCGGYKISVADLTDFKTHSFRIIPEIDIGLFGLIYFAYGYNLGITKTDKFPNMNNRFSINLTFPLSYRN